jgi:DNA-directed RNA polymerase subunit RPC12/RpoP
VVDSQTCVTCGKRAPETETNYTLISAQFGWRLTRFKGPDGSLVLEWRCPTCWREFKRLRTTGGPQVSAGAPANHSSWPPPPNGSASASATPPTASGTPPTVSGVPGVPVSGPPRTSRRSSR